MGVPNPSLSTPTRSITAEELAKHNTETDNWIHVDGKVMDITEFADMHPGGSMILRQVAGKDATKSFYAFHRQEVLTKYLPKLQIGVLVGHRPVVPLQDPAGFSAVPYAEIPAYQGIPSPLYTERHKAFSKAIREFVDRELMPDAETLRATGNPPDRAILKKMAQFELIAMRIGPGPHLKGRQLPAGITPEEFDYTYTALTHAEMSRLGIYTIGEAYSSGVMIGLPPVMNFGPPALRDRIVNEVLGGDRTIALAVTEPHVGSDVANLTTTATLTADGRFYVVNGLKKWITNGRIMVNGKAQPSDYFTTAVRTGGPGMKGISVLVIPFAEGVSVRPIKTSGSSSAGTALVEFDNVKVPADHLLGKLNGGFPVIMTNFNKERWAMVSGILPACREVVTECYKWVNQREAFGKPLAKQPVLMHKLGAMTAELEAIQAYFDAITYAMNHLPAGEQAQKLAGPIALLKFRATRAMHQIVDDAVQIFGGRALTQTGMGQKVEHLQRVYKFGAILGGAEEILTSLAVRQAFRAFPPSARL